jgi:hypothetical protein
MPLDTGPSSLFSLSLSNIFSRWLASLIGHQLAPHSNNSPIFSHKTIDSYNIILQVTVFFDWFSHLSHVFFFFNSRESSSQHSHDHRSTSDRQSSTHVVHNNIHCCCFQVSTATHSHQSTETSTGSCRSHRLFFIQQSPPPPPLQQ